MTHARRPAPLPALALCALLALGGAASAQGGGALSSQQYRDISDALDTAVRSRASNPSRSLAEIDRARDRFQELAPSFGNSPLTAGIRQALTNTRIAVGRSQTDLEAQVLSTRGLLRKALHDETLSGLSARREAAVQNLAALADDFGVASGERAALLDAARAGNVDLVRAQLERTAVAKTSAALSGVNPAERAAAYLSMARAASWFNVVQDSPRAGALRPTAFVDAITSLTSNDTAGFTRQLAALREGTNTFAAASATEVRRAQSGATAPTPAPTPAPGNANTPAPAPAATPNVPAAPPSSFGALYGELARALNAVGHGDQAGARRALEGASRAYAGLPANVRTAEGADALRADLDRARTLLALREPDVQALIGGAANVERASLNAAPSAIDAASAGVSRAFGGPLRAVLFIALGLLALYPLYLLNLAFGGRNPYWRAIGVALLLFLLPTMLEGVASLGALLEGSTGVAVFGGLTNLSLGQHALGGLVWVLSVAIGIGLATWGFRGICIQFGLLGRRARGDAATQQQPAVEWDEEL